MLMEQLLAWRVQLLEKRLIEQKYTYIHTSHIHTYIHTYIHTHILTYTHTYIHTYIHTHTHTYIHTHTHTPLMAARTTDTLKIYIQITFMLQGSPTGATRFRIHKLKNMTDRKK